MTKNKPRKPFVIFAVLIVFTFGLLIFFSPSESEVVNQNVIDEWCEQAWHDMITLKEGRYTDARLIENIMRGHC